MTLRTVGDGGVTLRTVGIIHLCPGIGCAVCRWVDRKFWNVDLRHEVNFPMKSGAKRVDAAVGKCSNEATHSSAKTPERA